MNFLIESFRNICVPFIYFQKVTEMWDMIKYVLQLPPFPKTEDTIIARDSKAVKQALVTQGKAYLEKRYRTFMENVISDNLQLALRGGVPGTYNLVRSYVGLRLPGGCLGLQDGQIDEKPLWPMVYYCLRCGDYSAALHCLQKAGYVLFFNIIFNKFADFDYYPAIITT